MVNATGVNFSAFDFTRLSTIRMNVLSTIPSRLPKPQVKDICSYRSDALCCRCNR